MKPVGILLAGGRASRMGGGDKALRVFAGRPLLGHVIERIGPQVAALALNANGDPARFASWGLPVIADRVAGSAGPLAGILAGIDWAAEAWPAATHILSVPTDTPFLPRDLVGRLQAALAPDGEGAAVAIAASGGRVHPVVALWPVTLRDHLYQALTDAGIRKVEEFARRQRIAVAEFATDPIDPFFNVNRPEDLDEAARLMIG